VNTAKQPPSLTLGKAIDAKSLAGGNVWVISINDSDQIIANIQSGVDSAAQAAGLGVHNVDARGSATTASQGISNAVASGASAIVIIAVKTADVGGALAKASKNAIPVVSAYEKGSSPHQLFAVVSPNNKLAGKYQGAEALALTGCDTHALVVNSPVLTAQQEFEAGAKAEINKVCAKACTVDKVTYQLSSEATDVPQKVSNALRRNPKINVLITGNDGTAQESIPAIQRLGSDAKIVGQGGIASSLKRIQKGKVQVADIVQPPGQVAGWMLMDQALRAMLHQPPSPDDDIPIRLITTENIGNGKLSSLFPDFVNYQAKFKETWGLS
jgi:ABC-type sugar transport system substrate-binding protein